MSVNLSPSELGRETLARDVARVLQDADLLPESLMIEIAESELMRDLSTRPMSGSRNSADSGYDSYSTISEPAVHRWNGSLPSRSMR